PVEPERIADRLDVRGRRCDVATGLRIGAAVPGAVVADQPDPLALRVLHVQLVENVRARRPVVDDDGQAVGIAAVGDGERATFGPADGSKRHGPILSNGTESAQSCRATAASVASGGGLKSQGGIDDCQSLWSVHRRLRFESGALRPRYHRGWQSSAG